MSRKLLARGKKKLESQFPINQHIRRVQSQVESRSGLDVPTDFREFAKLCRIRSGSSIVPFEIWDWQEELSYVADKYNVCCFKTRQLGCTEIFAAKMLHKSCLSSAYAGACLSMGGKETSAIAKRVRRMPAQIPNFRFETNAVTNLSIQGGGSINFCPSTDNAVRSIESVHDLLFDEAAFVNNIAEIYSSAVPAQEMVGKDARTWVISTMSQQGKLCWFWSEMFDTANGNIDVERAIARAQEGLEPFQYWVDENGWAKVIVHWKAHPIYSQIPDYLAKTKKEKKLTEEKLQREYNLGIPESGGSLFVRDLIPRMSVGVWREALAEHHYLAGIDPNFGGDDYFVMQVWDITNKPYQLVREYRDNNKSSIYNQEKCKLLLIQYSPLITAVEKNSGGVVILENLAREHPHLKFEPVSTSKTSKIVNTDRLALALEAKEVVYPSNWVGCSKHYDDADNLIEGEMFSFGAADRKALKGHDDTVMAWAAAFAYLDEALKLIEDVSRADWIDDL